MIRRQEGKMLKFVLILLVTVATGSARKYPDYLPGELIKVIQTLHQTCFPKHGVTLEDVANYESTNKDPKMMCYMQCMMMEAHWMSKKFEIRYDYIINTAHPEIKSLLEAAVNKCRNPPEPTAECEAAYIFQACLAEADPEHWFLP